MTEKSKSTPYKQAADRFIHELGSKRSPLFNSFPAGELKAPVNGVSGQSYSGLNRLLLSQGAVNDPRWFTKKQALEAGYSLNDNAQGRKVIYWDFKEEKHVTDENGQFVLDESGHALTETVKRERPAMRFYTVYHASELHRENGQALPPYEAPVKDFDMEKLQDIVKASGVNIKHDQKQFRSFYRGGDDSIHMMPRENYPDEKTYVADVLKGIIRASRHKERLNRPCGPHGTEDYAREELRVVLSSMMLAQDFNLPFSSGQNENYARSWAEILRKDPYELNRACRDAEQAKEYVMGLDREQEAEKNKVQGLMPEVINEMRSAVQAASSVELMRIVETMDEEQPELAGNNYFSAVLHDLKEIGGEIAVSGLDDSHPGLEEKWKTISTMIDDFEKSYFQQSRSSGLAVPDSVSLYIVTAYRRVRQEDGEQPLPWIKAENDQNAQFYAVEKDGEIVHTFLNLAEAQEEAKWRDLLAAHKGLNTKLNIAPFIENKVYLNVPYLEKAVAKEFGATWDNGKKSWCARPGSDLNKLSSWIPEHERQNAALQLPRLEASSLEPHAARTAIDRLATVSDINDYDDCVALAEFSSQHLDAIAQNSELPLTQHFKLAAEKAIAAYSAYKYGSMPEGPGRNETEAFIKTLGDVVQEYDQALTQEYQATRHNDLGAVPVVEEAQTAGPEFAAEKTYLNVPYMEKEAAKSFGAQWDKDAKLWYVPEGTDLNLVAKWLPENIPNPNKSMAMGPQEEFAQALEQAGLKLDGLPVMDGKIHRVGVDGGKSGSLDGAYCAYLDGRPNGWIQNHKTGEKIKWVATGQVLSEEQKTALKLEAAEKQARREQERAALQETAILKAQEAFSLGRDDLHTLSDNYLDRKGVFKHHRENELSDYLLSDIRCDHEANILIPGYDQDGNLKTVQAIRSDGCKAFAKGCPKVGAMHIIDPHVKMIGEWISHLDQEIIEPKTIFPSKLNEISNPKEILIAEGYATGASLHLAAGLPVVVAFDAGNLKAVAQSVREIFPEADITICADNDHKLDINVGSEKAKEAAQAIDARVVLPSFTQEEISAGLTDFNDLHQSRGLEAVATSFGRKQVFTLDQGEAKAKPGLGQKNRCEGMSR